jgi:hypothetical protein
VTEDATLGGYFRVHTRPPAFEGSDGAAYSVAVFVDEEPGADGRLGGALLFVRWSAGGEEPTGHLESDHLAFGRTAAEVEAQVHALSLHQVKEELDRAIQRDRERPSWK